MFGSRVKFGAAALTLAALVNTVSFISVQANEPVFEPQAPIFRLRAYRWVPGDMWVPDGIKLPQKVDPQLVKEIKFVRSSLRNWSGVHYIKPGATGSGI